MVRNENRILKGQGFQGVKCREITPVAELARVRTIGHSIRILANSATSVGKPHLGSPVLKGCQKR